MKKIFFITDKTVLRIISTFVTAIMVLISFNIITVNAQSNSMFHHAQTKEPQSELELLAQITTGTQMPVPKSKPVPGESPGKIKIVIQGEWIYLSNYSDGYSLYAMKTDGSIWQKLNDNCSGEINVTGDIIYYRNCSDAGKLYRIMTDGNGMQKINDDTSWYITVVGDLIYYVNESDNMNLYKIKIDGSGRQKLSNDRAMDIKVSGNQIYYINNSDGGKLYTIKTDGAGTQMMSNDRSRYIDVSGDLICYRNESDGGKLYIIKTDGSGRQKLNDDNSADIKVVSDRIYYSNVSDGGKLYTIKTDGNGRQKLNDDRSAHINVSDDWIYYAHQRDDGKLYKIKTDGSDRQKMSAIAIFDTPFRSSSNNSENTKGTIFGEAFVKSDSPQGIIENPVKTTPVKLLDPKTLAILQTVNTNQSGEFTFEGVTPGEYIINITRLDTYDHPVAVSVKTGTNTVERQYIRSYSILLEPWDIFDKYPDFEYASTKILTVCECLEQESLKSLQILTSAIIIGNLVQTPEGTWLQQSCGNVVKSGDHIWPDAIFLSKYTRSEPSERTSSFLKEADERFGKMFIHNNNSSDSIAVAVYGTFTVGDDLAYVKCGENNEKTCGFGYGPIVAPVQFDYWDMRYLNQSNTNKH